jgi:hypothetical protein
MFMLPSRCKQAQVASTSHTRDCVEKDSRIALKISDSETCFLAWLTQILLIGLA